MKTLVLISLLLFAPSALAACVPVAGDRILGSDLSLAHGGFSELDPNVDLGPAPAAGARRIFKLLEIERIATKYAIPRPSQGFEEACFMRATMVLDEASLRSVLESVLAQEERTASANLDIVEFSRNPLPLGTLEFPLTGLSESGLWRGRLLYGANRSVPIWARVRVTTADAKPLAFWKGSGNPEIRSGDKVLVEVTSGGVLLRFEASAESSGHVGEQVTVRNPANGQRFRTVVEAAGKVGIHK